jgi:hypothetical protein
MLLLLLRRSGLNRYECASHFQALDVLAVTNTAPQKEKAAGVYFLATLAISWQPIRDTLRNFFLSPTIETVSFLATVAGTLEF